MDVLMVTAELGPQARATAVGDSIAALAKALRQLGHTVSVALPRYPSHETSGLLLARRLSPLVLEPGLEVTVLDGQLASGVSLVLFDAPVFAEQRPILGDPDSAEGEADGARFALLARAAEALVRERRAIGKAPDVVHLHDWPAAALAALPKSEGDPPRVLTIHDARRERSFDPKTLGLLGPAAYDERASVNGRTSFLRLGLAHADAVTTVSSGYAAELEAGGFGPLLRSRATPLSGVLDGLDYAVYNPATDSALEARYDAEDASNKLRSKTALLRALELELELERPLVLVLSNGAAAGAMPAFLAALPTLLEHDLAVVVAGSTDDSTRTALERLKREHPGDLGLVDGAEEPALRRLIAAGDFVLTLRRGVPCAYDELASQRYGAFPIAHASGGVLDVIVDTDGELETGTGFTYTDFSAEALLAALRRGLSAYVHPDFNGLRRRLLRRDVGWDRTARRYVQVYRQARGESGVA
jgi:starch synthase